MTYVPRRRHRIDADGDENHGTKGTRRPVSSETDQRYVVDKRGEQWEQVETHE